MNNRDGTAFLQWALPRIGLRWPGFRKVRRLVCKRLGRRLRELGLADLAQYRPLLERDPAERQAFDALCRIPISRFYRDRGVFDALRERVLVIGIHERLPAALDTVRPLRIAPGLYEKTEQTGRDR